MTAAALLAVLLAALPAAAATARTTPDQQATPTPAPTPQPAETGDTAPTPQEPAPEAGGQQPRPPWIKRLREWAHRTVAGSAAWFDGLFGDERVDDGVYVTRAWLTGYLAWDEDDGLEPKLRLRARFVFPQMERKLGLLIGRGDDDDRFSGMEAGGSAIDRLPGAENDTVAGLEYVPLEGTGSRLSFSAGARIASPIDPYVRARYRHLLPLGENALLRFRQTVFWRDTKGFGTTSAIDIERRRSKGFLLRWNVSGTVSEADDGLAYNTGVTVYRALGSESALAWHGWVAGESAAPVPTREYGVDVEFRQRLMWWWLIGGVRVGHAWRREELIDDRHGVWLAAVGLEMQLGPTN